VPLRRQKSERVGDEHLLRSAHRAKEEGTKRQQKHSRERGGGEKWGPKKLTFFQFKDIYMTSPHQRTTESHMVKKKRQEKNRK